MNRDFAEILAALSGAGAEFLVVGAHALAAQPASAGDRRSRYLGSGNARERKESLERSDGVR